MATHNFAYGFRLGLPRGVAPLDLGALSRGFSEAAGALAGALADRVAPGTPPVAVAVDATATRLTVSVGSAARTRAARRSCTMKLYRAGRGDVHGAPDAAVVYQLAAAACRVVRRHAGRADVFCFLPTLILRQDTFGLPGHVQLDDLVWALRRRPRAGVRVHMQDVRVRCVKAALELHEDAYEPDDHLLRPERANAEVREALFRALPQPPRCEPGRRLTFMVYEIGKVNVLGRSASAAAYDACVVRAQELLREFCYAPAPPTALPARASARLRQMRVALRGSAVRQAAAGSADKSHSSGGVA